MLKKNRASLIFSITGIISILAMFVWFYNITGMKSLLVWHPTTALIPLLYKIIIVIIVLSLAVKMILNKLQKVRAEKISFFVNLGFSAVGVIASLVLVLMYVPAGHYLRKDFTRVANPLYEKNIESLERIAVSSDPHWNGETANPSERSKVISAVGKGGYDAFFCLGDISDWGATKDGYEEPVKELNEGLNGIPFQAVMGNHDALIDSKTIFDRIFFGKKHAPLDYRMDFGDVHIIVFDALWSPDEIGKKRIKWFEKQVKNIPEKDAVIVMAHSYFLSSGYVDKPNKMNWYDSPYAIETLSPLFEKYNVDLVLSGHNHLMELLEKDGVTYAVIGAMG